MSEIHSTLWDTAGHDPVKFGRALFKMHYDSTVSMYKKSEGSPDNPAKRRLVLCAHGKASLDGFTFSRKMDLSSADKTKVLLAIVKAAESRLPTGWDLNRVITQMHTGN